MAGFKAVMGYIAKEDPDNFDLKRFEMGRTPREPEDENFIEGIKSCLTLEAALNRYCKKASQATGIIALWNVLTKPKVELPLLPPMIRPWQEELLEEIDEKCQNSRQIIWYYDPIGNTGKSTFLAHLEDTCPHQWMAINGTSSSREVTHLALEALKKGWNGFGIIYDLCRTQMDNHGIYTVLELLKNGRYSSTKYMGGRVAMRSPWVIVLANFWPDITALSRDRWDIRWISAVDYSVRHCRPEEVTPEPRVFPNSHF